MVSRNHQGFEKCDCVSIAQLRDMQQCDQVANLEYGLSDNGCLPKGAQGLRYQPDD
jgi:hypothetical protein